MRARNLAAVLAAASLVFAACGGDDDDGAGATTTAGEKCQPKEDGLTVGLLYDVTGRGDQSFNDAAAAGADRAVCDFGIKLTESTPTGDADRAERIKLIADTNELVISVGFLWAEATTAQAKASPDTKFAIVDSVVEEPNTASLVFAENEGSYLVGVAAAKMSKSGKIGFIGGVENDLIRKFEAGYVAGAKSVNPDISIDVKYITQPPDFSGFNDAAKAKEIALAMYSGGADVVYHAAGGSGQGLFTAAKESGQPGEVWAIGVDSDQYLTVPEDLKPYILTSMLKKVDVAVYETIKSVVEGGFKAEVRVFDLKADGVGYSTSGDFLSKEAIDAIEEAKQKIVDGEITVPDKP